MYAHKVCRLVWGKCSFLVVVVVVLVEKVLGWFPRVQADKMINFKPVCRFFFTFSLSSQALLSRFGRGQAEHGRRIKVNLIIGKGGRVHLPAFHLSLLNADNTRRRLHDKVPLRSTLLVVKEKFNEIWELELRKKSSVFHVHKPAVHLD